MSEIGFKEIPCDLYRRVEPEAGETLPPLTGRMRARRPTEEFHPNWDYLLSGRASKAAVVAGLYCNAPMGSPEHAWETVFVIYCPEASKMLNTSGLSFVRWQMGRCEVSLANKIAATANVELGGYNVFTVVDVPGMVAEIGRLLRRLG